MNRETILRLSSTVAFIAMVAVNAMANLLPINNLTTGEVADLYPSLFTPAGITFSIWSVIYFLLLGFVIYSWTHRADEKITSLLPWFILTCLLNVSWILVWHYLYPAVSVAIMLCFLVTLAKIFLHVNKNIPDRKGAQFLVSLPFTLYFAWISVATIANVSALLTSLEWDGGFFTPQQWTVVMMIVAAALAGKIMADYRTVSYGAVVIWALIGIYLRWRQSDYDYIIYTSMILVIMLVVTIVYIKTRKKVI